MAAFPEKLRAAESGKAWTVFEEKLLAIGTRVDRHR